MRAVWLRLWVRIGEAVIVRLREDDDRSVGGVESEYGPKLKKPKGSGEAW